MKNEILNNNSIYIADVGASGGLNKRWEKDCFNVKGVLFEPDPDSFKALTKNQNSDLIYINSALSNVKKEVSLNICKWREASSIFEPNFDILKNFVDPERFEVIDKIILETERLDVLLKDTPIKELDFIKLDTQGSELEILKGCENNLDKIIGIEVEVEFIEIYKNQPLFENVHEYIISRGFTLFDLKKTFWKKNHYFHNIEKGQLIYADALYFKTPESILKIENISKEKVVKSIFIYLAYGYLSLSEEILDSGLKQNIFSNIEYRTIKKFLNSEFKTTILPDFKGKGRLHNLFSFLSKKLLINSFSSGTDTKLGN